MLGDMTELGAAEAPGHRAVGRAVGEAGIDTRRIGHSEASPSQQTRRTVLWPPYKGVLNRRFKRVFAYFTCSSSSRMPRRMSVSIISLIWR